LLMIFPIIFFCAKSNELASTRHTSRHTRRAELVLNVIGKFFLHSDKPSIQETKLHSY